ncbi:MAG TPA: alpha amylase C-terminal domain-containing protein [Solirubrobacteraceae bacterium]|nr:alpha amylase C-terminal domain-containing protein [Solirubrobacteraceae bacterium]
MPAAQTHIGPGTPMGACLTDGGATFRLWAPRAEHVYVVLHGEPVPPGADRELVKDPSTGHWTGFIPGVNVGSGFRYYIRGPGGAELKRDPRARELEFAGPPDCDCVVTDPWAYPWHDADFRAPAFSDLIVYQLHVGRFYARDATGADRRINRVAKLLDALDRVEYLAALGVNAVQPLPLVEFETPSSMGYNGTDIFSPDQDYCVPDADLEPYLRRVNQLLAGRAEPPVGLADLRGQINQLKAFVDLCHLHGIAVIADVVFNHGGGSFDRHSMNNLDLAFGPGNNLYFTDDGWAGGLVYAFARPEVEAFLVDNARMWLEEYHADGIRFDEVTVIDRYGGWRFCQDLTATLRFGHPSAVLIAEYWGERWRAVVGPPDGMGFDIGYADGLRNAIRGVIGQAAGGAAATVDMGQLTGGLQRPWGVPQAWQAYNCIENHDLVYDGDGDGHRQPRVAALAGGNDSRSWYSRSRARVANGLLLTAPGVPMLFMGQEFLQDTFWTDDPANAADLIWWDGAEGADPAMADFLRCTSDLISLRRRHPGLRADAVYVYPPDNANRVLAFQRWVPSTGHDVVVVACLREESFQNGSYVLGLPQPGHWYEVFNSDFYDHMPNPSVTGNGGGIDAAGPPMHGLPYSAGITIPANGLVVFARDLGD